MTTPYVGNEGNVQGTFPEQTPCLEHNNSIYISQDVKCQTCHMPEVDSAVVISNMPSGLTSRAPFMQHYFVGGNSIILNILKNNISKLNITASREYIDTTIANLMDLLQNETALVEINEAGLDGNTLMIDLDISQIAGHKFPTGFPSRRAWIHLTVKDRDGKVVFESGKPDNEGRIIGCDADEDAAKFEPHYDIITQPGQVQIYEAIMQDIDGKVTYTLLRGADYAKDNRLLPPGFDIENAVDNIAIHGAAINDKNFIGGSDRIKYEIDTQSYSGPFTISLELLYQTISYQFIQDLYKDNSSLIDDFEDLYKEADKTPTLITSVTKTVQ